MASKPGEYIDWVSDDGASKLTSQNASEQNLGFVSNTPASPTIMNWILNKISKWLIFLDELELNQVSDSTDYKKVKTESLTSNEVDHTKILNKGSNSHSTIDSHIGASAAHGVSGDVVGTSDDQELTTKTIDADSNTISNLEHGNEVDNPTTAHGTSSAIVGKDDTQTLTQKTLTSPKINEDVALTSTSSEIDAAVGAGTANAIIGDSTPGRVLRRIRLEVKDGTNPNTLKFQVYNLWNGENNGPTDNVSKDSTVGSFYFGVGGIAMNFAPSDSCVAVVSCVLGFNSSASDLVIEGYESANGIGIVWHYSTGGSICDMATILSGSSTLKIYITYLTDA